MSGTSSHQHRHFLPALGEHRPVAFYDALGLVAGARRVYAAVADLADVGAGATVVDVGCGSGALLRRVGRGRPDLHLCGVDPDERMLRAARRTAARSRDRSVREARFERGYAQQIPAGDGTVDRVLASLMFHHLDPGGRTAMLAEVRRALRPGGALVLADLDGGGPHGRRSPMHAFGPGDLPALLAGAGFAVRTQRRVRTLFGGVAALRAEPA
jgi:SAM-dependent methyltransferase